MTLERDYIIIGQGLAGAALAWDLIRRGKSVMVFDLPSQNRASAVAAGLFNPITGRVMTKTWKAEAIFPFLTNFYREAERSLKKKFLFETPIYRPFHSLQERQQWETKSASPELKPFLAGFHEPGAFSHQAYDLFGGIEIAQSGYLDVNGWLSGVREFLRAKLSFREEAFDEDLLVIDSFVRYKDCQARQIIFCNGLQALNSRWFGWLPLRPLKGEVIDVRMDSSPDRIYNQGVYLVPFGSPNVLRVGATYEHSPFLDAVTSEARNTLDSRLRNLVRLPFEIIHQDWGIRPTTTDRRPLLGAHPVYKNVVIFNGLGTKGVSLAPYFAHQMGDWLEGHEDLSAEVNINRFKALYSR